MSDTLGLEINMFNVYKYYLIYYKTKSKLSRVGHPPTPNQHVAFTN